MFIHQTCSVSMGKGLTSNVLMTQANRFNSTASRVQRRDVTSVNWNSQERVGEGMGTWAGPGRCRGFDWSMGGGGLSRDNTNEGTEAEAASQHYRWGNRVIKTSFFFLFKVHCFKELFIHL